jgi:hypothetical protein
MNSSDEARSPQTPPGSGGHPLDNIDKSTEHRTDEEKIDLESQTVDTPNRSLNHYFGFSSPAPQDLENVEEEEDDIELADSEDGDSHSDTADVTASSYQESVFSPQPPLGFDQHRL